MAPQLCHLKFHGVLPICENVMITQTFENLKKTQAPLGPCPCESSGDGASFAPMKAPVRPHGTSAMPLTNFMVFGDFTTIEKTMASARETKQTAFEQKNI